MPNKSMNRTMINRAIRDFAAGKKRPDGYKRPKSWYVLDNKGRSYPAKAIWALAINQKPASFNTRDARKGLMQWGYVVIDIKKEFAISDEATDASFLSTEKLEEIVDVDVDVDNDQKPQKTTIETTVFIRNSCISELAKRKAAGICQLCLDAAPFKNRDGQPYLETHHIEWLSRDGEDSLSNTVALCPNCHRKMHVVDSEQDKQYLKSRVQALTKKSK